MQYIEFKELPVNAIFYLNGNKCKKQSSRTLSLEEYNSWFYCSDTAICVVNNYSRLSLDYFNQ